MNETQHIEAYLLNQLSAEDKLLAEARLLTNNEFKARVEAQKHSYLAIALFGRKRLKQEIMQAEKRLFSEPRFAKFRATVSAIFK